MTKLKKWSMRCIASLLALAMVMLPVPQVSAAEYTASGATEFEFTNSTITVSEGSYSGYKVEGTELTINASGTYIVSGSCSNGSIKIKKGTTGVTLVLDGLTLTSLTTAPVSCNKSTEVNIVVASGTTNSLTDNEKNNDENYPDNENAENAVIKCKDGSNVTISGSGSLSITANGKNGIKSGATTDEEGTASLTIKDVSLTIDSPVNDAINAEQTLSIESGTLTISTEDDAIHSDYVLNIGAADTTGPTIKIKSCYEGLEASTLNIFSGNISITSSDDCMNAANSDLTDYSFAMNISGGTINAYTSSGDGFDSNGTITISGGTVNVWSSNAADNQPLDADGTIKITGGTVLAAGNSSGTGMNINASQGYVTFGSTSMGGGMGGNMGRQPGSINGQTGSSTTGNSVNASTSVTKGSTVSIKDSSSSVFSTAALCNASYIFFSSPSLESGTSYTLYSDSNSIATATAQTGVSQSGSMGGGMGGGARPDNMQQPGSGQLQPGQAPDQNQGSNSGSGSSSSSSGSSSSSSSSSSSGSSSSSSTNSTSGNKFSDVSSGSWYYDAVQYVYSSGLMSGTGSSVFSPNSSTTRGMIVTILYRLEGSPSTGNSTFSDVSSSQYYAKAVAWAAENGIVSGYSSSSFAPDDAITREQLAAILYRYAAYKNYEVSNLASITDYSDSALVSSYAKTPLSWAVQSGIISGTDANKLSPSGGATRAQVATMLMRFCQSYKAV